MATPYRHKRSSIQDKAPLPADLATGELAVNFNAASPAVYLKDDAGAVVKIAGAGAIGGTPATETALGIAELATQAEVDAGTDDERIVTPLKLATRYVHKTDGTGAAVLPSGTTAQRPTAAAIGQIRWNTDLDRYEGYDGSNWSGLGGGATPSTTPPGTAQSGDLWWNEDDGRLYVYYTDADGSQWVDASPDSQVPATIDWNNVTNKPANLGGWNRDGATSTLSPAVAGDDVDLGTGDLSAAAGTFSGDVKIGGTSAAPTTKLNADGTVNIKSNAVNVDASGRLLVGTSSSTADAAAVFLGRPSAPSGTGGEIKLAHPMTNVPASGTLGRIHFGNTGDDRGAEIAAVASQTWTSTAKGAYLTFSTTADGASSPTERVRIGSSGGIDVSADGNGDNNLRATTNQTTTNAANVYIDATTGALRRSTSSIKYKTDVETLQDSFADEILKCRPVWYRSTSDYDNQQWGYYGFIAEEVVKIDPRLCFFSEDEHGNQQVEGVQYDRFVPHLLNLIKRQQKAIETLEAEVASLKAANGGIN